MLHAFGFGVNALERNAKSLMKERFEDPVTADHCNGELVAASAQSQRLRRRALPLEQSVAFQQALCFADRDSAYLEVARQGGGSHRAISAELVNSLDVIFPRSRPRPIGADREEFPPQLVTHG